MGTAHLQSRFFVVRRRPRLAAIKSHPEMDFADYERRLASLQQALQLIQQAYLGTSERALLVLEGWDTAGKGGIVRRLGWALDPRSFKVHPIAAPDQHEHAQHYLQRFWCRLPEQGQIVTFDRSWYGRVLVERVEGFASGKEWRRAYREINEFERMLVDSGVRLVKLFLHITPNEQGHLIPANNKPYGRIAALRILVDRLGKDVALEPRPIDPGILKQAKRSLRLSAADIRRASPPGKRKVRARRNASKR
jgi:polyphosphate kinase 2 (PPK2 family)